MTRAIARAAFWTCNGCNDEVDGWSHRLPEGWTMLPAVYAGARLPRQVQPERHYCPKCAPPLAQQNEPSDGEAA